MALGTSEWEDDVEHKNHPEFHSLTSSNHHAARNHLLFEKFTILMAKNFSFLRMFKFCSNHFKSASPDFLWPLMFSSQNQPTKNITWFLSSSIWCPADGFFNNRLHLFLEIHLEHWYCLLWLYMAAGLQILETNHSWKIGKPTFVLYHCWAWYRIKNESDAFERLRSACQIIILLTLL